LVVRAIIPDFLALIFAQTVEIIPQHGSHRAARIARKHGVSAAAIAAKASIEQFAGGSGAAFQEIHQIFNATGSVAVADVMARRIVITKFRGSDPVIHLLVDVGVSDPLLAGCDD
jgi:hypothetical protein